PRSKQTSLIILHLYGRPPFGAAADCQKTVPGGLEGRSPPNAIRIRRHVRRIRKPCCARFPCAVSRPGAPRGREGNGVNLGKGRRRRTFSTHCGRPSGRPFSFCILHFECITRRFPVYI